MGTFGTWAFKNVRDPDGIKQGCDKIETINATLKTINNVFGWINPFGYVAYERYGQAVDYYVAETRKAANTPGEYTPRNTYANANTSSKTYQLSLSDQMPFGKHKGKTIQQVLDEAPDYLQWMIANVPRVTFNDDVTRAIAQKSLQTTK